MFRADLWWHEARTVIGDDGGHSLRYSPPFIDGENFEGWLKDKKKVLRYDSRRQGGRTKGISGRNNNNSVRAWSNVSIRNLKLKTGKRALNLMVDSQNQGPNNGRDYD